MDRIVIIGTSCAGKTTLAQRIAEILKVEHIELDALHWGPEWKPVELEEFRRSVAKAVDADKWVVDGNYVQVRDLIWPRATTIIWLDYRFPVIYWRALSRTFRRVLTRETLWAGNRERLRTTLFSRESILWWVVRTYSSRRKKYPTLLTQVRHAQVLRFRAPHVTDLWLKSLVD